ncbi:hypothetical protein GN244_ATG03651 [Phytophthora infestans]|uniref:Uncharacterized protein n=1 Tax=Phytophthora infestans TaxID=4787 RepID=A0A833S9X0_PHYIN|nr:hypothetical protein GN244_ATG03651 [Phytophthora infestans]
MNHPHVAKMLDACHIGKKPFVAHKPAEPLVSNRANAQSWEPLPGGLWDCNISTNASSNT